MRAGDIVVLKSGGPLMTVNGFDDHGRCEVVWFIAWPPTPGRPPAPRVETAWFATDALEYAGALKPADVEQPQPAAGRRHHIGLVPDPGRWIVTSCIKGETAPLAIRGPWLSESSAQRAIEQIGLDVDDFNITPETP